MFDDELAKSGSDPSKYLARLFGVFTFAAGTNKFALNQHLILEILQAVIGKIFPETKHF